MNDIVLYIIIAVAVILLGVIGYFVLNKPKKESFDSSNIVSLFDKESIVTIEYIRNKIVVAFKDVTTFDAERLKELGAKGINIIGDKIKFYISDDNTVNEKTFKNLKEYLER